MDFDKDKELEKIKAIMSSEEAKVELAHKLAETTKHIISLGEAIDMLLDDLGPAAMALGSVGIVISLNVSGENVFSLAQGLGSNVKRAIADLVYDIIKDTDKEN